MVARGRQGEPLLRAEFTRLVAVCLGRLPAKPQSAVIAGRRDALPDSNHRAGTSGLLLHRRPDGFDIIWANGDAVIYAIEAVRYGKNGLIDAVRWHTIEYSDGGLKKGPSEVVDARTAMRAAVEHAVHIFYDGAPGSKVGVGQTDRGTVLVDRPSTPQNQLLEQLPRF